MSPADEREVCRALNIVNNYITDVTNEDWGTHGICAGFVRDINIAHNTISEVSYTAISLGWGWNRTVGCMRNNTVHANLIHHYAKHMYDVAGIYTLGSQPHSSLRRIVYIVFINPVMYMTPIIGFIFILMKVLPLSLFAIIGRRRTSSSKMPMVPVMCGKTTVLR